MKLFSKLFLGFTLVVLLVWQLPGCYAFLTLQPVKTPFTLYSSLLGDFIQTQASGPQKVDRFDTRGHRYTQREVDSLLPCFYVRQLTADERFPDTLGGIPVSPKAIKHTNFLFKSSPSEINASRTGLYFLLESLSGRVDLKMPKDAFRFTDHGIEFLHMATNRLDTAKSRAFTEVLRKKGFAFPARYVSGNPSTHKEYDDGYLLLDNRYHLYHLKCTKGLPYVKALPLPSGMQPTHVYLTEFTDRRILGFLVDCHQRLHVIRRNGDIRVTGLPAFRPEQDELVIFGNRFDWTIKWTDGTDEHLYALRADDYRLLQTLERKHVYPSVPGLSFTVPTDKDVRPRF